MTLSFQLYSSREVPSQAAFLGELASLGYGQVEGYRGVYEEPALFRAALDAAELSMPSGHFGIAELEDDFEGCVSRARALGITHMFAPFLDASLRPTDGPGYAAFAHRLTEMHKKLADEGFVFGWHNHDFELVPLDDGAIPLAVILEEAPDLAWEADLAWIIRGGADPVSWLDRFGDRMAAVHIKDIAPQGQNLDEDGWADVGDGTVNWPDLVTRMRACAPDALHIMEHDKPSDAQRFARTSVATYKTF